MTPTETNIILNIGDFRKYSDTYAESGSCHGHSIERALAAGFEKIKSAEAWKPFYNMCIDKFNGNHKVELYFGLSQELFPKMLDGVDKAAVIFLDGHPTGFGSAGHDDLMEKGDASEFHQHYIITHELKAILAHRNDHILIIDDINGNNPEAAEYVATLSAANPNYEFFFYDEQLPGGIFYKNKSLVAIPK